MLLETWLTLLVLSVAALASLAYLYLSIKNSSTMFFMIWIGLVGLSASRFLYFYQDRLSEVIYYQDLVSIGGLAFILSGLFMMIRDAKPVFARFPSSFTFLPLAILPFYPLLADKAVLRDLINIIIQGGGLAVAILILSIRQLKSAKHLILILGILILGAAYTFRWFIPIDSDDNWASDIFLAAGMVICTYGFLKQSISTKKDTVT
jgi:vacuolar-type H+-ATPase subunit I/STV1